MTNAPNGGGGRGGGRGASREREGSGSGPERSALLRGHRQGAESVRSVVRAAPDLGIRTLTLYAFSSDNWKRPPAEVSVLMKLLRKYLKTEIDELNENGVRLKVVGRRDRLSPSLMKAIEDAERRTALGDRLELRLAVDYSSRDLLLQAVRAAAAASDMDRRDLSTLLGEAMNGDGRAPDVDLLIRSGGERRLSDFLLWECAYAELHFTPTMWPDFRGHDLKAAVDDFRARDRRFGEVAAAS